MPVACDPLVMPHQRHKKKLGFLAADLSAIFVVSPTTLMRTYVSFTRQISFVGKT